MSSFTLKLLSLVCALTLTPYCLYAESASLWVPSSKKISDQDLWNANQQSRPVWWYGPSVDFWAIDQQTD